MFVQIVMNIAKIAQDLQTLNVPHVLGTIISSVIRQNVTPSALIKATMLIHN